jgi:kynurenine formamidase
MNRSAIIITLAVVVARHVAAEDPELWKLCRALQQHRFVDLTHEFDTRSPHWPGFPAMSAKTLYTYDKDGFWAEEFTHVGQYGTHVDPPAHFHKGLRTVDQIPATDLVLPLAVIDLHEKVGKNPDAILTAGDIRDWESRNGPIPAGAFVAFRSDWSKRWPDQARMQNKDSNGVAHYPGWTLDALKFLVEQRKVTAIGHETLDTDPGLKTSKDIYECESYVLGQNRYQIELLTNLDQVPEKGALFICAFPKLRNGSGFPARVFAIIPAQ